MSSIQPVAGRIAAVWLVVVVFGRRKSGEWWLAAAPETNPDQEKESSGRNGVVQYRRKYCSFSTIRF
jgi:hypothetical protein